MQTARKLKEHWNDRWLRYIEEETEAPLSLRAYRAKLFWSKLKKDFDDYIDKQTQKKYDNYRRRYGIAPARK